MFSDLITSESDLFGSLDGADGWVLQDSDGLVLAIESPNRSLYGWDHSALDGTIGAQMVHPDDRVAVSKLRNLTRAHHRPRQRHTAGRRGPPAVETSGLRRHQPE